ncbi:UvrD-helicase domain-containing protein [Chromohalobacter canadensis]|uniref:UvrD-helicase domain-containing protein n=1 Tax=Chromohalobacter canadensis TaxID=141389 RepID=UPI0021C0F154|nr:UvrD-helicase domain-containing protein [Chromohalobacter canadensis]MCT8467213.1 UvrD-helicase domain-containing protein [Chromohalobacter canadensis]MCT8471039.1 UvrD-helicase domain-containing protein [Chromohalobacter canadensis]MCT8497710.1 UvrD-helicase domain-containing protein [Chromohalobacter canadensis]
MSYTQPTGEGSDRKILVMQVLKRVQPTPQQISVVRRIQTGASLIRGAAGSGKTTTALLALRAATGAAVNQLRNDGRLPANILVLAFNNSLRSYINAVAEDEMADYADDVRLFISTFDRWVLDTIDIGIMNRANEARLRLNQLASSFPRDINFIVDEVEYLLGRLPPEQLDEYITIRRSGRGGSPAMPNDVRRKLLDEVVNPYLDWKHENGVRDFNDLAVDMMRAQPDFKYDVIVVDEAQDLSANQMRAVMRHAADDATITIVTDSAQRIYPRGTPWAEAGIEIVPARSFRLSVNYRNTREITALAASLAAGINVDDDGNPPDPSACQREGRLPTLILGKFGRQLNYVIDRLRQIDLERETVGFLHLKGGGWFDDIREALADHGFAFCELQGAHEWPAGAANIGLCTFHSAKGLEFDHVFMIGLAAQHASYGEAPDDDRYDTHRRLVAMGVGRARKTVILGTKPGEDLPLLQAIPADLVEMVRL